MDEDLMKLCKEVYEKTGWAVSNYTDDWILNVPSYNSDYLLEKLPKEVDEYTIGVVWDKNVDEWRGEYGDNVLHLVHADTPLKALLKLVLALKEAGEL